jgi:hypothetical protein
MTAVTSKRLVWPTRACSKGKAGSNFRIARRVSSDTLALAAIVRSVASSDTDETIADSRDEVIVRLDRIEEKLDYLGHVAIQLGEAAESLANQGPAALIKMMRSMK